MNNWYVITGRTCSGKTTTIELLRERGIRTSPETATMIIEEGLQSGKTLDEIRKFDHLFQRDVLQRKIDFEALIPKHEVCFFDRGIPDTIGFYKLLQLPFDKGLEKAVQSCWYKKIFFLEALPYEKATHRGEDFDAAQKVGDYILEAYQSLPFPIVSVPVMEKEKRVDFILKNL